MTTMQRRHFLSTVTSVTPLFLTASPRIQSLAGADKPLPLPDDLVKEFVRVGHGEFDEVKRMLEDRPGLLNACYDWGGGDFETALEGAGHVGSREVAEFLISRGAHANIFVLTMLGHTTPVKAVLQAFPYLLRSKGPHGLSLLHHAQRGGEAAAELRDFLLRSGLNETRFTLP